jgi:alkylhydroperoxidase family enzyme
MPHEKEMIMPRVTAVRKPGDYPGTPDEQTRADLAELFGHMFPGAENPEIDKAHTGMAIAALNPRLALHLSKLSGFAALQFGWSQRSDLREIAIQTVNLHFKSAFSAKSRFKAWEAAGLGMNQLASLPYWKTTDLFDDEQRLVIEYALAVVSGEVPEALFVRVADLYGEKGAVECTAVIGIWSMWAMLLNATQPGCD